MTLTTMILLVLALYLVQLLLQEMSRFRFDIWAVVGNRDAPPEITTIAARLDRAKNNMLEALPLFLALALLALVKGADPSQALQGAAIFLVARIIYVPAYVSGIPMLRSLVWLVANAGLIVMALPLI